ncbi:hypothetical protein GUJ93_ZPchr0007g4427 [Zizania palustris]|uniref:Uncharacterized protein n=1 Tax=Zizania palustris TaxID=103762 RepID=A0A8J5T657_ZIZPA|nr:hypothetical protein GUJ93_ZPchr0007g4427 [Zizania palustris]
MACIKSAQRAALTALAAKAPYLAAGTMSDGSGVRVESIGVVVAVSGDKLSAPPWRIECDGRCGLPL